MSGLFLSVKEFRAYCKDIPIGTEISILKQEGLDESSLYQ